MPNDEDEKDRLDIMHAMMLATMSRKLFLAPISQTPRYVLDLGTGTGLWAIDFGRLYKHALPLRFLTPNELAADKFPNTEVRITDVLALLVRVSQLKGPPIR